MKRRVRKIANFFAFNLLFFALYLNFIHKDKVAAVPVDTSRTAAFSGNLVENRTAAPSNASSGSEQTSAVATGSDQPLRLSIN